MAELKEEKVIEVLSKEPMSISKLAKKLDKRRDFISGYLEALKEEGVLKVIQVGRSKVYQPLEGER